MVNGAAGWFEADQRVFLNDLLDLAQPTELRSLYDAMDNAAATPFAGADLSRSEPADCHGRGAGITEFRYA